MKLGADIINNLKLLDYEYGGGITVDDARVDTISKPILIVGLGGTGAEALIRVKKSINKHFKLHTASDGRRLDRPLNIEYLAIDSDDNTENLKYDGISFSRESKEFVLLNSSNLTSIYKNKDAVFKAFTRDWISDNLRLQQVKHGAGGIRQAGRFLFFINMNNVLSVITEKINRLVTNRESKDLLYVFIIAGVSGGTGSGTFIDIPYIIRKVAEAKGFGTENIGMLFLPDVTLSDNTIDGAAALNIKANGFAGLKELDYLMNIERNGEVFKQKYSDIEVETNLPPYDLCHLISSKDESGKLIKNAKNYCMNVAAETIINFIASEEITDGQNYTINSYLSNIENTKTTFLMTHSQKQPTNYIYNIVGTSSAVLPIDYLINHLTYKVFNELSPLYENSPTQDELVQTLQALKIDLISIEREIEMDKPKPKDLSRYDYNVLKLHPEIVEDAINSEILRNKEYIDQKAMQIIFRLKEQLEGNQNIIASHFTDLELGPFYARKELSAVYDNSLLKLIDGIRKRDLVQKKESPEAIKALEAKKQAAMSKLLGKFAIMKGAIADNVIDAHEQYCKAIIRNEMYSAIDKIYEEAYRMLEELGYKIVDTYCELLLSLKELFDKFKNPEAKAANETLGESFTWDIVDAKEFCESVTSDRDLMQDINNKAILQQLLKDIISSPEKWILGKGANVADSINHFITRELHAATTKSMDYYLALIAKEKNMTALQYIEHKVEELKTNAKVMFPMNHIPTGLYIEFPPYSYLSIPHNAPSIRNKVRSLAGTGNNYNLKFSKMLNRIYMLNLKIAVPLYCYKELNDYEAVYEASAGKLSGLHLYEGESPNMNWRNLPSPNYDKLWVAGYENRNELERNEHIRQVFDKGLDYSLIQFDERNRRYVCRFGEPVNIFEAYNIKKADIMGNAISITDAVKLASKLRSFLADKSRLIHEKSIFDVEFLADKKTPDNEYVKGVFIYMPELNTKIAEEVKTYEEATEILKALSKIEETEVKYSNFAQLVYMGKVFKSRKNYKYTINGEEKILFTLDNMQEKFVEYKLFQAFLKMEQADATVLLAEAIDEENNCSDQRYEEILSTIDTIIESYNEKLTLLTDIFSNEAGMAQTVAFYSTMLEVLNKEKEALK